MNCGRPGPKRWRHKLDAYQQDWRAPVIPASDGRLTISVPIQIKRRSGRKLVTVPRADTAPRPWNGEPMRLPDGARPRVSVARFVELGEVKSLRELARKEGIDSSYVSRMVNLVTLAPDIVAAILDETLPSDLMLFELAVDPPTL